MGFAVLQPPTANRRNQPVEIGTGRGLFAGELAGGDCVARLAERHDFAFEVPGGKPFCHVFRQGTAKRAHAFEPDRTAIAAVGSGREEKQLSAAFAPKRDDLRQTISRGMVGLVDKKGLAGEVRGQVIGSETVQGCVGTCKGVVKRSGLAKVVDDPLYGAESAFPRPFNQGFGHLDGWSSHAVMIGKGDRLVVTLDEALLIDGLPCFTPTA